MKNILVIIFFLVSCSVLKKQMAVNVSNLKIIATKKQLSKFFAYDCIIKDKDTLTIILEKNKNFPIDKTKKINLIEIFTVQDSISYRLHDRTYYINEELIFKKNRKVYIIRD